MISNYNNPNQVGTQQTSMQFPYGNSNVLLTNTPYDNYAGRMVNGQNQGLNLNYQQFNQFLKCRPVSSKEEAMAYQIDLDGSLWVFTDLGNEKIYTKQVNNDGTATFKAYSLIEDENPYTSTEYVTKAEFDKAIQKLTSAISSNDIKETKVQPNGETLVGF